MTDTHAIWAAAEAAVVRGDAAALEQLLRDHASELRGGRPRSSWCGGLAPNFSEADARAILVREHHFQNLNQWVQHRAAAMKEDSPVAAFENAADAIVSGDLATLETLLRERPDLVHARSWRQHHATLLHYVGANGIEGWRQRTPPNVVSVAGLLLRAGAVIDAMADMYGGSTTLGLVATSIHPRQAGVQNELMDILLTHGAAMDPPGSAGNGQNIVNGCLANGRPGAAEFLARRGARLDLEGASGVGNLEVVRQFFSADGSLNDRATPAQLQSGFQWACQYGRTEVVEFLLRQEIEPDRIHRGQTGLHWAAYAGHVDIVNRLLARKGPLNLADERFHATPLGWAHYGRSNPPTEGGGGRYEDVVAALVAAGANG